MTLGGTLMVRNAIQYDYCVVEAINSLKELCDEIVVVNVGSDDGTAELLWDLVDVKTTVIELSKKEWDDFKGREKLAHFTNVAIGCLTTDYNFNLQADEIIHENCFPAIRKAIETGKEAFYCSRINLWRDCNSYINVEPERQPCSTQIIRLAKSKYKSVDDGESIAASADPSFVNDIRIYHMGFVRSRSVMKAKIIHLQEGVFGIPHDPKLDKSVIFDSELWFSGNELSPITEELPKYIKTWAISRP